MFNLNCLSFFVLINLLTLLSIINASPIIVHHVVAKQPQKSQAITISDGKDNFKGDKLLKDNEVGYFTKTNERGNDGYTRYESFHDKDGDNYGYEKHEAYGESDIGSNENGKKDGKKGHTYQVFEHQDDNEGISGGGDKSKIKDQSSHDDDGGYFKGYSFSINSHDDDDDYNGNNKYTNKEQLNHNDENEGDDDKDNEEYNEEYYDDNESDHDDVAKSEENVTPHNTAGNDKSKHSENPDQGKTGGSYKKVKENDDYSYDVEVNHDADDANHSNQNANVEYTDDITGPESNKNNNYATAAAADVKDSDSDSDDNGDHGKTVGDHGTIGKNSYETYIIHPEVVHEHNKGTEESSKSYEKYQIEISDSIKPTIIATKEIIHEKVKNTKKPIIKNLDIHIKNNNNNRVVNKHNQQHDTLHTNINDNHINGNVNKDRKDHQHYDDDEKQTENNDHEDEDNDNKDDDDDDDDNADDNNAYNHNKYSNHEDYRKAYYLDSIPKNRGDSLTHYRNDNNDYDGYGNHYVYASEADSDAIIK